MIKISFIAFILILSLTATSQTNNQKFEFSPATAQPNARALMKEDFYWSPIDDSGPFGSDAGSDAAYGFHQWRQTNKSTSPILYLKELMSSWNFPPFAWDQLDTTAIKLYQATPVHLDETFVKQMIEILKKENERNAAATGGGKQLTDEQLRQIVLDSKTNIGVSYLNNIDEAIIGVAFAQFVMEGKIHPTLKYYAEKTLRREMLPVVTRQFGQPDQVKAHNDKTNKMLKLINKMPTR